ncbi:MAG TPA: V-type ATP synthase subunit D [Planctomycetota bacterium]|nr:V-type ATP synthase subunit D [Planctomycetota bacterium]
MALDVKPTRSQLLELRRKVKLSINGHKILKMKRDGLIIEFFKLLNKAKSVRAELVASFRKASHGLALAETVDGKMAVEAAALARAADLDIKVGSSNLMGVVVPKIDSKSLKVRIDKRGQGLIAPAGRVHEATVAYEELIERILFAAEVETAVRKLLDEIEKTKRRVNALEFKILPELRAAERFVRMRLEEMEREGLFSMKRIKKSGEKRAILEAAKKAALAAGTAAAN